jgi:transcriptional regulator
MNITPNNIVELLKTASEMIIDLSKQVEAAERVKEAMSLVEPLTRKGIILEGKTLSEKTESLIKRADYDELRIIAKRSPIAFSLGEVSKEANASKRDALDRLVFGDY